jgi:hypothetical protein
MAHSIRSPVRLAVTALAIVALGFALQPSVFVRAATPTPAAAPSSSTADGSLSLTATPLLGGRIRLGAWAAYRVQLENHGPAIDGELRITAPLQTDSVYGIAVQLASGARQEHVIYAPSGPFGSRARISLVSAGTVVVQAEVRTDTRPSGRAVYLIAERPEAIVGVVHTAAAAGTTRAPEVTAIAPEDLPPRVEAWASMDTLVWHDVESARLTAEQVAALKTWVATGGHLVVMGGSTGVATLGAFPADLLPYVPERVVEVSTDDLRAMMGDLPVTATPVPAVAGQLAQGVVLGRAGESVVAARTSVGQGSVALIGLGPTAAWMTDFSPAEALWARAFAVDAVVDIGAENDDEFLLYNLANLPSVQIPRFEHLAVLVIAYVLAIGPLNYFFLRRRDRRELAWLTMPLTIAVFAIGAYSLGFVLRGASVVVNELAIVRGAAGTESGVAEVHVGVYAPSRTAFQVRIGGDPLVSAPQAPSFPGGGDFGDNPRERPIDVLLGDPATLRDYSVGFGAVRTFRAHAAVDSPRVDADLTVSGDTISGSLTNASGLALDHVALVFGNSVQLIGAMAPGASQPISVTRAISRAPLYERMFPAEVAADAEAARIAATRRVVLQHLAGGWSAGEFAPPRGVFARGPVILAWRSAAPLEIDVGTSSRTVAETVYVLPARATIQGPTVFTTDLVGHAIVESDGLDAAEDAGFYSLTQGTISAEYRPLTFDGTFEIRRLALRLGTRSGAPSATGNPITPLPADEQPDPDSPLASNPRAGERPADMPRVQLYDRVAEAWVELEPMSASRTFDVADPTRYVDANGAFRVRFVSAASVAFTFDVRLEGTIE